MAAVKLIRTTGLPILQQLRIEEALLRATDKNWCLLNDGCSQPAVVMGISGKPEELIHQEEAKAASIQVLKRFSGGGTVVVDSDTLFVSLIMESKSLPAVECYPRPIMQWSREFYDPIFGQYGDFHLREHDYAFGERKFGGNAQAITKQRWLHHTSLLWYFDQRRMEILKFPAKTPRYREGRRHCDFVCMLRDFASDRQAILDAVPKRLTDFGFSIEMTTIEAVEDYLNLDYVKSNKIVELG